MRLIDADAAAEKIAEQIKMHGEDLAANMILDAFVKFLRDDEETPTIVDTRSLWADMRCIETLDDMLDPVDDDTSLIHFRVDDVRRSLYAAAQDLWILQGGKGMRMHWEGDPCPVRLGSDANGCWIKCKDCANTRCTRRHVEEDGDDE